MSRVVRRRWSGDLGPEVTGRAVPNETRPFSVHLEVPPKKLLTYKGSCLIILAMRNVRKLEHGCQPQPSMTWAYRVQPARTGHRSIRLG